MVKREKDFIDITLSTVFYCCRVFLSPVLICLAVLFLSFSPPDGHPGRNLFRLYSLGGFLLGALPHIAAFIYIRRNRKKIRTILADVKRPESFLPASDNEFWEPWSEAYLGFDTQRGTFVYIRLDLWGEVDLAGFDLRSWTGVEADGRLITIRTTFTEAPELSMKTRRGDAEKILRLTDTLSARNYQYACHFPGYVAHRARRISKALNTVIHAYH